MFFKKLREKKIEEEIEKEEREKARRSVNRQEFHKLLDRDLAEELQYVNHLKELGCFKSDYIEVKPLTEVIYQRMCRYDSGGDYEYSRYHVIEDISRDYNRISRYGRNLKLPLDLIFELAGNKLPITYKVPEDWIEISIINGADIDSLEDNIYYLHKPTGVTVKFLYMTELVVEDLLVEHND